MYALSRLDPVLRLLKDKPAYLLGRFSKIRKVQTPVSDTLLNLPDEWRHVSFIAHSPFKFLQDQTRDLTAVGDLGELIRKIAGACQCETLVCSMFTHSHLVSNLAVWKESREPKPTK